MLLFLNEYIVDAVTPIMSKAKGISKDLCRAVNQVALMKAHINAHR